MNIVVLKPILTLIGLVQLLIRGPPRVTTHLFGVIWLHGGVRNRGVVARSSAKAEFRAMSHGICEMLWLKRVLEEVRQPIEGVMKLYCDNKAAISIAHNPIQHDRTKHVEIDRHFIKEKF